jgi:LysR family hca operon transcriptional activator
MPADHRLTKRDAMTASDIAEDQLVGMALEKSPALRTVTDRQSARRGLDLTPDHNVDNLAMAVSLVTSTRGIALMPLHAHNLLPPSVTSRPRADAAPTIDWPPSDNHANTSPLLTSSIARLADLKCPNRSNAVTRPSQTRS